jgi:hypothetical protein
MHCSLMNWRSNNNYQNYLRVLHCFYKNLDSLRCRATNLERIRHLILDYVTCGFWFKSDLIGNVRSGNPKLSMWMCTDIIICQ